MIWAIRRRETWTSLGHRFLILCARWCSPLHLIISLLRFIASQTTLPVTLAMDHLRTLSSESTSLVDIILDLEAMEYLPSDPPSSPPTTTSSPPTSPLKRRRGSVEDEDENEPERPKPRPRLSTTVAKMAPETKSRPGWARGPDALKRFMRTRWSR